MQITKLLDPDSVDSERYAKMGLHLDPNNAKINVRNVKDAIF